MAEKLQRAVAALAKIRQDVEAAMETASSERQMGKLRTQLTEKAAKMTQVYDACIGLLEDGDSVADDMAAKRDDASAAADELLAKVDSWLTKPSGSDVNGDAVTEAAQMKQMLADLQARFDAQAETIEQQRLDFDRRQGELERRTRGAADTSVDTPREAEQVRPAPENDSDGDDQARAPAAGRSRSPASSTSVRYDQPSSLDRLAEALQRGFSLPQPELPTFNGDPLEYTKFMHCFEAVIEGKVDYDKTRLMYLIQQCRGEAKSAIDMCSLMGGSEGYHMAKEILRSRYGRKHHVARACVDRILYGPPLKPNDPKALSQLALEMQRTNITLKATGYSGDVDNTETLKKLVRRLPAYLRQRWVDVALNIIDDGREPRFEDLSKFVDSKARAANSLFGLELHDRSRDAAPENQSSGRRGDTRSDRHTDSTKTNWTTNLVTAAVP